MNYSNFVQPLPNFPFKKQYFINTVCSQLWSKNYNNYAKVKNMQTCCITLCAHSFAAIWLTGDGSDSHCLLTLVFGFQNNVSQLGSQKNHAHTRKRSRGCWLYATVISFNCICQNLWILILYVLYVLCTRFVLWSQCHGSWLQNTFLFPERQHVTMHLRCFSRGHRWY